MTKTEKNYAMAISQRFARLEALGLVRLECKPDEYADIDDLEGDCFDPKHNPDVDPSQLEAERKAFHARINREGVWGLVGEYADGTHWAHADSCWGFVGDDMINSGYDVDIKALTIEALRAHIRGRCRCCKGTGKKS